MEILKIGDPSRFTKLDGAALVFTHEGVREVIVEFNTAAMTYVVSEGGQFIAKGEGRWNLRVWADGETRFDVSSDDDVWYYTKDEFVVGLQDYGAPSYVDPDRVLPRRDPALDAIRYAMRQSQLAFQQSLQELRNEFAEKSRSDGPTDVDPDGSGGETSPARGAKKPAKPTSVEEPGETDEGTGDGKSVKD